MAHVYYTMILDVARYFIECVENRHLYGLFIIDPKIIIELSRYLNTF